MIYYIKEEKEISRDDVTTIRDLIKYIRQQYRKWKNKKKDQNNQNNKTYDDTPPKNIELIPFSSQEKSDIDKNIKSIVRKFNSDPNIKKRMKLSLQKYEEAWKEQIPYAPLGCKIFEPESSDVELWYDLTPSTKYQYGQVYNTAYFEIRCDIAKELNKQLDYVIADGDFGDGDEGIIIIVKR